MCSFYNRVYYKFSEIHKLAFTIFLLASISHMILSYKITKSYTNVTSVPNHVRSLKWKVNSIIVNSISMALAVYFFYRHNEYCEPFGKV